MDNPEDADSLNSDVLALLKEIYCPLRMFKLRACLQLGRLEEAENEISCLDTIESSSESNNRWNISRSLEYARLQLKYLKVCSQSLF